MIMNTEQQGIFAQPKMPDHITSRSCRGSGVFEEKRTAVVAECDRIIAEAKAKLAELTLQD